MNKRVIHIQCYPPHFHYVVNLLEALHNHTDDLEDFDIVIVVDRPADVSNFLDGNKKRLSRIKNLSVTSVYDILTRPFNYLFYNESFQEVDFSIHQGINVLHGGHWGSANTPVRKWMNIKRSYGLMELERRGYEYVWCIDAESFPLTNFSVNDIFSYSDTNYLLSVFEQGGWNNSDIVNHVLKIEDDTLSQMLKVGVRINDFWIINLQFFRNMIQELTNKHRKPLSYFVLGTEQGLYELWLYHKHLTKSLDIEVIPFTNEDFDGICEIPEYGLEVWCCLHWLFNDVHNNPDVDNKKFAEHIQSYYFDKVHSYRGDLIRGGHAELLKHMNFKFAVSNWQGN